MELIIHLLKIQINSYFFINYFFFQIRVIIFWTMKIEKLVKFEDWSLMLLAKFGYFTFDKSSN